MVVGGHDFKKYFLPSSHILTSCILHSRILQIPKSTLDGRPPTRLAPPEPPAFPAAAQVVAATYAPCPVPRDEHIRPPEAEGDGFNIPPQRDEKRPSASRVCLPPRILTFPTSHASKVPLPRPARLRPAGPSPTCPAHSLPARASPSGRSRQLRPTQQPSPPQNPPRVAPPLLSPPLPLPSRVSPMVRAPRQLQPHP